MDKNTKESYFLFAPEDREFVGNAAKKLCPDLPKETINSIKSGNLSIRQAIDDFREKQALKRLRSKLNVS